MMMLMIRLPLLLLLTTTVFAQINEEVNEFEGRTLSAGDVEGTGKEIDRHIRHLNSTDRKVLQNAIRETAQEMERIKEEARSFGCIVNDENFGDLELDDMDPVEQGASPSEDCKPLLVELEEMKMKSLVLAAVKVLDDDIRSSELMESTESRKKRSAETQATLASIDERLELGAKMLGKSNPKGERNSPRKTRTSALQAKASLPCSYVGQYTSALSDRAIASGHTIQESVGGDIGVFLTATAEVALTYGQRGEFGCAATLCTGFRTNIGVGVGVAEGYYYNFEDVAGTSKATIYSAGIGPLSFSYGSAKTTDGRDIGKIIGAGIGLSLLPFDVAVYDCNTVMNQPDCYRRTVKYTEKYYSSCGWLGWSRCSRSRTKYKYSYSC